MAELKVTDLRKQYGDTVAVDGISFEVEDQEIFGLLGPNGAGKTTTIRIIMDIYQADSGSVRVLGKPPGESRERIGYLPEERGLYQDISVMEALTYLATLKGVKRSRAAEQARHWLERVDLADRAEDDVASLSRGMQQKIQFIASMIHNPDLLILDEPFSGLDPINVEMIKNMIRELQREGKTIVLSSHQLNLVEELCDRIFVMAQGRSVLYGPVKQIKRDFSPPAMSIDTTAAPDALHVAGVRDVSRSNGSLMLTLEQGTEPRTVLKQLIEREIDVSAFQVAEAPLEEIFIDRVQEGRRE